MIRWFILFNFALLATHSSYSESDAAWSFWTVTDGLASSRCKTIKINHENYVWIGNGLHYYMSGFDGFQFDRFVNPMISTIPIAAGLENDLWMESIDGLKHYQNGQWEDHAINGFSESVDFAAYDAMKLFILTPTQLLAHDIAANTNEILLDVQETQMKRFIELSPPRQNGFWIGCDEGLIQVAYSIANQKLQAQIHEYKQDNLDVSNFHSLNIAPNGDVIAIADSRTSQVEKIVRFDQQSLETLYERDGDIREAWQDENQHTWFYTSFDLYRLDGNEAVEIVKKGPLVGEFYDVEPEQNSSFWVATSEGLARYNPSLWQTPRELSHLDAWVHAIREDPQQRVWFLSNEHLLCYQTPAWKIFPLPDGYTSHRYETEDLCLLPDGRLVMNTNNFSEFLVFDPVSESFDFIRHPQQTGIRIMAPSKDGRIWVRLQGVGESHFSLALYDGKNFEPYTLANGKTLYLDRVRCVHETAAGDIWIGCLTSIGVVQNGEFREWINEKEFPGVAALYINEIPNGEIWVGERNNIFSYSNGQWSTVASDLDAVRSILVDDDDSVWIASTSGIYRYYDNSLVQHDQSDGLISNITYKVYKDSQDRLWAGTAQGVARYYPMHDSDPPVTIIDLNSNPSQLSHVGEARILFNGIDKWKYTDTLRLLFSYRLDNGDWSPFMPDTVASYHSLPPGEHWFDVRAMDRNFNIDPTPERFVFTVNLPWYREPGFVILSSIGSLTTLILFLLLVFRYFKLEHLVYLRTQKLNQANKQLQYDAVQLREAEKRLRMMASELTIAEERERRKIASLLHDTIGHTLALCKMKLSRLKQNCQSDQLEPINEINSFTEQTIEDVHSIIFQISPPVLYELGFDRAVQWLVEEYQEQYQIPVDYEAYSVLEPMPEDRKILLFQIIRELLVNIAKHAQATKVRLQIDRENGSVHINIHDNGKGFQTRKVEEKFKGYGLFSIRQRLQYIAGRLEIESGEDSGSSISVVAPIDSETR